MKKLQQHIETYGDQLKTRFLSMRKLIKDSDVKGGENEKMVRDFMAPYVPHLFMSNGVTIIDSFDEQSGEMDIAVCNSYQIFGPDSSVLISEGVDFCVQVKSILSLNECRRFHSNCETLKQVRKNPMNSSTVLGVGGMDPSLYDYIPYIVVAFQTTTSIETIRNNLIQCSDGLPLEKQPDALFIIDPGFTFINCRQGDSSGYKVAGKPVKTWLGMETNNATLVEFVRYINSRIPRIVYPQSPASKYFSRTLPYKQYFTHA